MFCARLKKTALALKSVKKLTGEVRLMDKVEMKHSDFEIILKVWHGQFDWNNPEDMKQAEQTYDKLQWLKAEKQIKGHN